MKRLRLAPLSLLPLSAALACGGGGKSGQAPTPATAGQGGREGGSEEHTSELQSRLHLVCRLLLEKKKKKLYNNSSIFKIPNMRFLNAYHSFQHSIPHSNIRMSHTIRLTLTNLILPRRIT